KISKLLRKAGLWPTRYRGKPARKRDTLRSLIRGNDGAGDCGQRSVGESALVRHDPYGGTFHKPPALSFAPADPGSATMRRTRISMLCATLLVAIPASAEAGGLGSVVGAIASVPQTLLGGLRGGGRAHHPRHHARHTKSERSVARAAPAVRAAPAAAATAAVAPSATGPAPRAAAVAPAAPAEALGAVAAAP